MPTYEYECNACNYAFEELQSMTDKKLATCPECGKDELSRLIGAGSGFIFKGSGFYETDYKRKEPAQSEDASKSQSTTVNKEAGGSDPKKSPDQSTKKSPDQSTKKTE